MVPKIIFFKPILPRKTGWPLFLPGTETDKKVPVFLTLGRLRRAARSSRTSWAGRDPVLKGLRQN